MVCSNMHLSTTRNRRKLLQSQSHLANRKDAMMDTSTLC